MDFDVFPLVLAWELTLACNLRCRHCGSSAGSPRPNELTPKEALDLCDQFPALLVREVDFTGGEPLVRSDWPKIAERLAKLGIRTQVITNGLAFGPDTAAQMKDVGIVTVGFSLDGLEATHDHIRGHEGLFRHVVASIEQVLDVGIPLAVLTTVNGLNVNELPSMVALLQSIGVTHWQIQPIFPLGRSHETPELRLSEQAYMQMGIFFQDWKLKAKEGNLKIIPADSFGYSTELDTREPIWRGCPAGIAACGITSDGKIKGCLSLPDELVEGDLRKNDFWDIWFQPDAFSYTRGFSQEDLGPNCHNCEHAEYCKGGCSAMSYGSTQRFHNDPYCFLGIRKRSSSKLNLSRSLPVDE